MTVEAVDFDAVGWLISVPTGDVNFTGHMKSANSATIQVALGMVPANHKTKVKALGACLRRLQKGDKMAPKTTKEPRAHDEVAEASKEIYALATADAEKQLTAMREEIEAVRVESQASGALQAIGSTIAFQELMKAITLHRIKGNKEYKKGGMTWAAFCESLGFEVRTVDLMLTDIKSIVGTFSENFSSFAGVPFNKIRLLGKSVSENISEIKNNCLIYGDESIPLTPEYRDDIQALIERIGEEAREKVEEADSKLSAKDKVLKSKEDVINKQERELKKHDKAAAKKGLTTDEDAFLQLMSNKKTSFEGYMLSMDPDFVMENAGDITPRMRAALIAALHEMKMNILSAYDTAVMNYGSPGLNPEVLEEYEAWEKQQNQISQQ